MAKTHVIDGKKYVEVERSARIGDKVLIVKAEDTYGKYHNGSVIDVHRLASGGIENYDVRSDEDEGNSTGFIANREFVVIEPLDSEECCVDQSQASPQVIEMFATLSRKIVSLESQLRGTQRNLETFAEQTESNTQDIAMLDSRTYSLTATDSAEGILNEIERLLSRRGDR